MVNSNRVTLSDDTMTNLKKIGKPFETVDECIHRILSKNPRNTEEPKKDEEDE